MVERVYVCSVTARARVVTVGVAVGVALATFVVVVHPFRPGPACSPPIAEPIDPLSSQHLLPGTPEPAYLTNPPTSGAHRPGPLPARVRTSPLERPSQVAALEGGQVLVQYGHITPDARRRLVALAHQKDHVTVAPGRDLPSPVVATAWLFMQRCNRVDVHALRDFIAMHTGQHQGH
jgi:hypothetical protein